MSDEKKTATKNAKTAPKDALKGEPEESGSLQDNTKLEESYAVYKAIPAKLLTPQRQNAAALVMADPEGNLTALVEPTTAKNRHATYQEAYDKIADGSYGGGEAVEQFLIVNVITRTRTDLG